MKQIIIKEPQTPKEFEAYYLLRYEVLRKPWDQPLGSERDDQDPECIHAIALDENDIILGVCRLQSNSKTEVQLRYMGVNKIAQGLGIGKQMIHFMEEKARSIGAETMILQAREEAVDFYKKCGYSIVEKSYLMWDKIQHYLMKKKL